MPQMQAMEKVVIPAICSMVLFDREDHGAVGVKAGGTENPVSSREPMTMGDHSINHSTMLKNAIAKTPKPELHSPNDAVTRRRWPVAFLVQVRKQHYA